MQTEPHVINIGHVHPSTHGVFRMSATLDGKVVINLEPVFGYLHRGIEKLAEERTYTGIVPLTDRLDYVSSMTNNLGYCMAVEKLAGIKVPERAEYIRVIMSELQRVAAHFFFVDSFLKDCGSYFTPFLMTYRERERIVDLLEMVSGQCLLYNYMRPGGVSQDLPDEFIPALKALLDRMPKYIDEHERLLKENGILIARTRGVGILPKEMAVNIGASGPVLRSTGVKWDIRKVDPYSVYDRFEFDIPVGTQGDCCDRYRVRVEEIKQSFRIIAQAVNQIPAGSFRAEVPQLIRPPKGEAYGHIEAPTGELGFYLVSDGGIAPYRCHVRAPGLMNLTAIRDMMLGWKIQDLTVIFSSFAVNMGEVDR